MSNNYQIRKLLFLFILFCSLSCTILAQGYQLSSASLDITIDSTTGGIQSIINKQDKHLMNWVLKSDGTQYPWQTSNLAWGLGFGMVNGDTVRWNKPFSQHSGNNQCSFSYSTKYFNLIIERKLTADGVFTESFQFTNNTSNTISITDLGIYTPFNDNCPNAKTSVESRCNSHIWAGNNASYVFAQRMGGEAPHLGLVLTEGSIKSHELLNRNRGIYPSILSGSNVRGTIVLNPSDITLKPQQTYTLKWVVFPTNNWGDFYNTAQTLGFVKASAKSYLIEKDQTVQLEFVSNKKLKKVQCFLNGTKIDFSQTGNIVTVNAKPQSTGEQVVKIDYNDNQTTFAKVYRINNIDSLLAKRALFIVNKQQLNDTADKRDGAYMVYDNETHKIYLNDDKRKSSDTNEGRERLGMGIFLAMYLQTHPNATIQASLERYCKFVRTWLVEPNYMVNSGVGSERKRRGYNCPWVANLYLEMYNLTRDKKYLTDYYTILHRYFVNFKFGFYAIGVTVQDGLKELKKAEMNLEYDTLLSDCRKTADVFVQNSIYFPKSEVNYEQAIVGPSVVFLLEMYQITKEKKYLKEAEKQLKPLESFAGFQPDYHLNEIAIRHWDGYWFGKRQFWGDVMPHYWSVITAEAFARYAVITGNKDYQHRAATIVRNNLCQFFNDGSASCAYIYPSKVNGKKAAFFDPFANDQDWALVYYLKCLNQ